MLCHKEITLARSNIDILENTQTAQPEMLNRIDHIISELIDQYAWADDTYRPWIIGFSGGKDSTVLLQLVWRALEKAKHDLKIPLTREVYVVSNDTMVENPIITEYVQRCLNLIDKAARKQDLPIKVRKTIPRLEDSFWVNLIGRGYPAPNSSFRWCTERLKVRPTSRFILEQLDITGEAIILLGTRSDESAARAKSVRKFTVKGNRLSKHPNHQHTYTYAPIKHLMLEEIWFIINSMPSPWGADNSELFKIYADASADDYECPTVVTNKSHQSCGQSRFGCWVCTVVKQDKSMGALIGNGFSWLAPLLKFRNDIVEERSNPKNRFPYMRDGRLAKNEMGQYSFDYRAMLLERLLLTQREIQKEKPNIELITNQELIAIQAVWQRDMNFKHSVSRIYNTVYEKTIDMKKHIEKIQKEEDLLKKACEESPEDFELILDLLALQKNKALLTKKRGLKDDIEKRIEEALKVHKR